MDDSLYQAILARRSVRRYDRTPLDDVSLERVRTLAQNAEPLVPGNTWQVAYRDELAREDLGALLGAYGAIISAPHALVPYALWGQHFLADLGYRAEQIVVGMAALGLGSCFVGVLGREAPLRARLNLPADAHIGALLVYGREATTPGARGANRAIRALAGAARKLPLSRLCFREDCDHPGEPPVDWLPVLEAARSAPSAVNAQPWRFLVREGTLHVLVTRFTPRYGPLQDFRFYDGGICLANIQLALRSQGERGIWHLYDEAANDAPPHPDSLQPLARLESVEPLARGSASS